MSITCCDTHVSQSLNVFVHAAMPYQWRSIPFARPLCLWHPQQVQHGSSVCKPFSNSDSMFTTVGLGEVMKERRHRLPVHPHWRSDGIFHVAYWHSWQKGGNKIFQVASASGEMPTCGIRRCRKPDDLNVRDDQSGRSLAIER